MSKLPNAIEWEELLELLGRFANSYRVREVTIKNNETAHLMGRTPEAHVNLDIFVYYFGKAPSSAAQKEIAKGFIGENGPRKMWDGLNVAAAWDDPTVRLYNCLLFWPPGKDCISQTDEFRKIGFMSRGGSSYTFKKA